MRQPTGDGGQSAPQSLGRAKGHAETARVVNAMSIDIEEHFQVGAFENVIDPSSWDRLASRVEDNTDRVLKLFDNAGVKATFFTLGWIAERHPQLVRRIVEQGHELASHGYSHVRVTNQDAQGFRADVRKTKQLLEDVGGVAVNGYRAASFSIDDSVLWAFEVLAEEGYRYSSSVYPIQHDHYGMPSAPRRPFYPDGKDGIKEVPITTWDLLGRTLPCGGGGYFRLLPYAYFRTAYRRLNQRDRQSCVFYFHPWEVDPQQPRIPGIGAKARFRHYINLDKMQARLTRLLSDFAWDRMDRVFLEGGSAKAGAS